ncbi:MAG: ribonuclease III family protein, partial [Candidatus Eremiobacteraeota bacterium]|nr:ribonuclease III family protein [Candidatus Eremiobacteraeota bacterium]
MNERRRARLRALLKTAGATGVDPARVEGAFVHASAARENGLESNERLEFFGDAILGFAASRWLMARYPTASEGLLTRRRANLVSGAGCAETARRLGFSELVLLGAGMERDGGAQNLTILADAFEAFVAALLVATDLERTVAFLAKHHFEP